MTKTWRNFFFLTIETNPNFFFKNQDFDFSPKIVNHSFLQKSHILIFSQKKFHSQVINFYAFFKLMEHKIFDEKLASLMSCDIYFDLKEWGQGELN